jgi:tryptophanyl-tRNA synthetase
VVDCVRPIRERYRELMGDPAELDRLLAIGAGRAREVAEAKMVEVKEKMGFAVPEEVRWKG